MISLELKKSLTFSHNDVHMVEITSNSIIINNNYEGILFFTKNLDYQAKIDFDNKDTIINQTFIDDCWLLLDGAEESYLMLINSQTNQYFTINLIIDFVLTPLHYFTGESFILYTYDQRFIGVSIMDKSYKYIPSSIVKNTYQDFFNTCCLFSYYKPFSTDLVNKTFFYRKNDTELWSFQHDKEIFLGAELFETFSAFYMNNIPIISTENEIYTFVNHQPLILLKASTNEIYQPTTFLDNTHLVVASYHAANHKENYIKLYEVKL